MDVTSDRLAEAVDGMEITVDLLGRDVVPGTWTGAIIRYPADFASEVLARLAEQTEDEHAAQDHAEQAVQAVSASEWQRQKWGVTGHRDDLRASTWEMERAQVHVLLAIRDALLAAGPRPGTIAFDATDPLMMQVLDQALGEFAASRRNKAACGQTPVKHHLRAANTAENMRQYAMLRVTDHLAATASERENR